MRCSCRTVSYQLGSQSEISWLLTLEQQMLEEGALKLYGRHDWKLHSFLGHQEPGLHSPHHARVTPLHRAGPWNCPRSPLAIHPAHLHGGHSTQAPRPWCQRRRRSHGMTRMGMAAPPQRVAR